MIEIKRIQQQPDLAQAIYAVMADVYPVSPWTLEQIQADLSQDQTWYALAYDGTEVIGFLAVQENLFEAEVLQIAVLPSYQGQKIATALFDFLPADKEIFLEVRESNRPALLFYKKEKFEEIARRKAYYHAPIEDAIVMKREIHER
ncbi:ribosomal protein S18-alanine N-acetyltransferase [Streptococcus oralis]|uniref:[Ribosomal protein bS18]-alanine N-acetyltransferase n=1 Tax=Streptococcus oralis TaxID=1303 RepID=A0A4Q2FQZ0_STROR|nr:ribosomal protein S18-alanine N-acetyltransferase [Streptococcus oralis]MCY7061943.1 ribosomal protein S18-alanine N-acetyltransferase [Streptococcus oralis]RXX21556.1 ribosomal-protein-alanine N-acetyltransferase [Streptococcus oralis]